MDPQVSVIVPTYCEAENLPLLVPRVLSALEGLRSEIVVVDDDSPDGTKQVCAQLARRYPLQLLVRTGKRDLSWAVIHGMRNARGDVLVVMDADLSHPPEKIPELLRELNSDGVDFVIGSRYVIGASTDESWGLFRWVNSKVATLLARPLTGAKDPMAGFFAIERATFQSATSLNPVGYKIGLELITKCRCRKVREIPIHFSNRRHGFSKLNLKEQLRYLKHLKRLYEFKLGVAAKPIQFAMIGTTGMVVDLISFALLLQVTGLKLARALAIWIAMSWNFWLNRRLTFSYARTGQMPQQYVLFCLSCLLGASVNWSVFVALNSLYTSSLSRSLSFVAGILAGTGLNYVLSWRFVFDRPSKDTDLHSSSKTSGDRLSRRDRMSA